MEEKFQDEEISLSSLLEVLKRRKNVIIYFAAVVFVVIMGLTFLKKPVYEANSTIMIEREGNILIFNDLYTLETGRLDEKFNSQVKMIKSRTLAKRVIEKLNLYKEIIPDKPVEKENPVYVTTAINSFLDKLKVSPIPKTRLVEVKFRDTDPKRAAEIVNTLIDEYINFNLELKGEAARKASEYLSKEIERLRNSLAEKEKELQKYSQKKELYYLTDKQSTIVQKFAEVNDAYTKAQINRINLEAHYRELMNKSYEDYPEVINNPLIQNLKAEYSRLESEYTQKSQIFKPDYPEMQSLKSKIEALKKRIDTETKNIGEKALKEAQAKYLAALKAEQSLKKLLDQQKKQMAEASSSGIYYNSLKIEVQNLRNLLDTLTKKQKESVLSASLGGLHTSNIKIVDRAEIPLTPVSPNKKLNFLLAILLGLSGGVFLAFVVDAFDTSVKTPEEIESSYNVPVLGITPYLNGKSYGYYYSKKKGKKEKSPEAIKPELLVLQDPDSQFAELIKTITTSILLSRPEAPPKVIAVTSPMPGEGKTTISTNIALSLASLSKRVLIIDGDLRRPAVHKAFGISPRQGLSTYLTGRSALPEIVVKDKNFDKFFIIPVGPIPPNPIELLNSQTMGKMFDYLREKFDHIIIDTSPLIGISDPIIIGKHADGVILTAWAGKTSRKSLENSISTLRKYGIKLLGVVLNGAGYKGSYYYHDYYYYEYYTDRHSQSPST